MTRVCDETPLQEQPPDLFYKKSWSYKFLNIHRKTREVRTCLTWLKYVQNLQ